MRQGHQDQLIDPIDRDGASIRSQYQGILT